MCIPGIYSIYAALARTTDRLLIHDPSIFKIGKI